MFTLNDAKDAIKELGCDCAPETLLEGMNVEREHTDDPIEAAKIAYDHISEYPSYYAALKQMEVKLKDKVSNRKVK